jgi:hypothetical protein
MRRLLTDLVIGCSIALLVILNMLFVAFDSSFIYRGF